MDRGNANSTTLQRLSYFWIRMTPIFNLSYIFKKASKLEGRHIFQPIAIQSYRYRVYLQLKLDLETHNTKEQCK